MPPVRTRSSDRPNRKGEPHAPLSTEPAICCQAPSFLKHGVHACKAGATWLVLSTEQDRYFVFAGPQAEWFSEIAHPCGAEVRSASAAAFEDRLCARGILTRVAEDGRPVAAPPAAAPLANLPPAPHSTVRFIDAVRFTRAFLQLCHLQDPKRRKLRRILADAQRWKRDAQRKSRPPSREAAALARSFHALAPWFFSAHEACFFRSLLLVRFLALYGIAADWTFAVRASPFRAHCWVSADGCLLNEDADIAAGYTPLLTV
jgi:hypothetical protein